MCWLQVLDHDSAWVTRGLIKVLRVCEVSPCPAASCCWLCGWLPTELLAYRDRMESLDKSFFCSALAVAAVEVGGSACGGAVPEPDCNRHGGGWNMYLFCLKISSVSWFIMQLQLNSLDRNKRKGQSVNGHYYRFVLYYYKIFFVQQKKKFFSYPH